MNPQLTQSEKDILSHVGIYKSQILKSLILSYKKSNTKYDIVQLSKLSRKDLAVLRRQARNTK